MRHFIGVAVLVGACVPPVLGYLVRIDTDYTRFAYFFGLPVALLLSLFAEAIIGPRPPVPGTPALIPRAARKGTYLALKRPASRELWTLGGVVIVLLLVATNVTIPVAIANEQTNAGTTHDGSFLDMTRWLSANPQPGSVLTTQGAVRWVEALTDRGAFDVGPTWLLFEPWQIVNAEESYWALNAQYALTNNLQVFSFSGFNASVPSGLAGSPTYGAYIEGIQFPLLRLVPTSAFVYAVGRRVVHPVPRPGAPGSIVVVLDGHRADRDRDLSRRSFHGHRDHRARAGRRCLAESDLRSQARQPGLRGEPDAIEPVDGSVPPAHARQPRGWMEWFDAILEQFGSSGSAAWLLPVDQSSLGFPDREHNGFIVQRERSQQCFIDVHESHPVPTARGFAIVPDRRREQSRRVPSSAHVRLRVPFATRHSLPCGPESGGVYGHDPVLRIRLRVPPGLLQRRMDGASRMSPDSPSSGRGPDSARPPNIVTIVLDCARAKNFAHSGGDRIARTPEIDALARRGTAFPRAVAPANWTMPSHFSIFTGQYPNVHGIRTFQKRYPLPDTTAMFLQRAGYETAMFTEMVHLVGGYGMEEGFDVRRSRRVGISDEERTVANSLLGHAQFLYLGPGPDAPFQASAPHHAAHPTQPPPGRDVQAGCLRPVHARLLRRVDPHPSLRPPVLRLLQLRQRPRAVWSWAISATLAVTYRRVRTPELFVLLDEGPQERANPGSSL